MLTYEVSQNDSEKKYTLLENEFELQSEFEVKMLVKTLF